MYQAFISYSHTDLKAAERLYKKLTYYRLPSGLRRSAEDPPLPFFLDKEVLGAAPDLTDEIVQAIKHSRAMIVVCSPAVAKSDWVNKEIATFKKLKPGAPIFAVVIGGTGDALEYFPRALLEGTEPLAADLRVQGDGPRLGLSKLISGLTGVPLEKLLRREHRRRTQRVTAVTGTALALSILMTILAMTAMSAQQLAQQRQAQAEDMADFMLGELRTQLNRVGRIEALEGTADKVLEYHENENKFKCVNASRHIQALHFSAEIALTKGEQEKLAQHVAQAQEISDRSTINCKGSSQAVFDAAQTEWWMGEVIRYNWRKGDRNPQDPALDLVQEHWINYLQLAQRLSELEPDNLDYQLELPYARSSLGTLEMGQGNFTKALEWFQLAEEGFQAVARAKPSNELYQIEYADAMSWVSTALTKLGKRKLSLEKRSEHITKLQSIELKLQPDGEEDVNWNVRRNIATSQLRKIETLFLMGDTAAAKEAVSDAQSTIDELIRYEPRNKDWQEAKLTLARHSCKLSDRKSEPISCP